MKRIISVIIALCLTASLVAGFAMGTNAEVADKRVLPRAEKAPTLDGKRDDIYDKGFRETLNIGRSFVESCARTKISTRESPRRNSRPQALIFPLYGTQMFLTEQTSHV